MNLKSNLMGPLFYESINYPKFLLKITNKILMISACFTLQEASHLPTAEAQQGRYYRLVTLMQKG